MLAPVRRRTKFLTGGVAAELIECSALLRIPQCFVGFGDFLEAFLGVLFLRDVGMIFPRQFAVCLLDIVRAGITSHAENLVIVLVFHGEVASVSKWMIGKRADRIALSR